MLKFCAKQEKENTKLFISDNGKGISAAELTRVFEKGFTGIKERNVNGKKATGIGLYLCKKLCNYSTNLLLERIKGDM